MVTEATRHERRAAFRGKSRPGRVLPVRYRAACGADWTEWTDWIDAQTRDVGTGGAFVAAAVVASIGTPLTIQLHLPTTDIAFALPAIVRWTDGEGMGVQFVGVDVDVLLELNDYFATLG